MITILLLLAWLNYAVGVSVPWWLWTACFIEISVSYIIKKMEELK